MRLACPLQLVAIWAMLLGAEAALLSPAFEADLRSFVHQTMRCHHVPGMTLAVVKDAEVWKQGYGTAEFASGRPVDESTLFNIGSVTKSFTMTLLGILLTEKQLDWTAKVITILGPGYRFVDDYRTRELTLRDLLSHRTGLTQLTIGPDVGIPRQLSRAEYCKRMAFYPAAAPPRDTFIYNNMMYMMLGHVAEKLGGDSWENLMTSRVLQPIGMNSTRFVSVPDDVMNDDVAHPYIYTDGGFKNATVSIYNLYPAEPAGAILSNADDMSRYMKFHLNNGQTESGAQLLDKTLLSAAYRATIPTVSRYFQDSKLLTKPEFPISDTQIGYGYAWWSSTYRGYKRLWHGGVLQSYKTYVWLFPDMKIGIYGSVNGPMFKDYALHSVETVLYYVADYLLGVTPWLNATTACSYPEPWRNTTRHAPDPATPMYVHLSPGVLQEYTGSFGNHYLPDIAITAANSKLLLYMGNVRGLIHATAVKDRFMVELTEPWEFVATNTDGTNVTQTFPVMFSRSRDTGDVISIIVQYEVKVVYTKGVSILQNPFIDAPSPVGK